MRKWDKPRVGRWSSRHYKSMNDELGFISFQHNPQIHQQRSTINASPYWGIRTGRAGVGPGSRKFGERTKWRRRSKGGRFKSMLHERRNRRVFYPGVYAND